jgi:hypothetical protein
MAMTDQHPITPLPELVEEWRTDYMGRGHAFIDVAKEIAQWGADQELEACITWLDEMQLAGSGDIEVLRTGRRPKPPTLKEQALEQLREVNAMLQFQTTGSETSAIRRALEALPE